MSDNPFYKNRHEIKYHLVNSALAGVIAFLGAASDGEVTYRGAMAGVLAFLMVATIKLDEMPKFLEIVKQNRFLPNLLFAVGSVTLR